MGGLMNMGCIEAVGVVEGAEIRHVDAVFGDVIIGAGRAVDGIDAERGDEGFGGGEAFALGQDRPRFGRIAIDLIGVEQAERLGEKPSVRSEEHTSELQSLMRISYAVFCLKKKKNNTILSLYV